MKSFNTFTRIVSILVLGLFLTAPLHLKAYPPILRINWDNSMGQSWEEITSGCVELGEDNKVYIGLKIYTAQVDLGLYPAIGVRYTMSIQGQQISTGVTPVYFNNDFTNVIVDGFSVKEHKKIVEFDISSYCKNGAHIYVDFLFEVVYGGVLSSTLYPIGQTPNVWPTNIFQDVTGSSYVETKSITKEICCYKRPGSLPLINDLNDDTAVSQEYQQFELPEPEDVNGDNQTSQPILTGTSEIDNNIVVRPNPFNDIFIVELRLLQASTVNFECLDAQGRVIKKQVITYPTPGLYNLGFEMAGMQSGLYYVRVSTPAQSSIQKIVKVHN